MPWKCYRTQLVASGLSGVHNVSGHGIDAIVFKKLNGKITEIFILESKHTISNNSLKLSSTKIGLQMSNNWLKNNLFLLGNNTTDESTRIVADYCSKNLNKIQRVVTGIDPTTKTLWINSLTSF